MVSKRAAVALGICSLVAACAMSREMAQQRCAGYGFTPDHPQYEWCLNDEQTQQAAAQQGMQDAQQAILGGLLLGAAVNAAKAGAGRPALQYGDHGAASLVRVQTVGQQRQCFYNTPSGNVTVVVGLAQSCPETYAY